MLNGKQIVTVVTKKDNKEKQGKKTVLEVDWTNCPEDTAKALALQALVVKLQGSWRNKGIPDKAQVAVRDHAPGTRHQMSPEEAFASLTPEQRAELVKKYSVK